jgi:hypothetical protein
LNLNNLRRYITRIAVMLVRYEALVQAKLCCGMQGAIPSAVAEVRRRRLTPG